VCTALDQCHDVGTCASGTGLCSNPNKADGATCNDSNACTQTDTCVAGSCTGGNPVVCTALDQCHDPGTCAPGTGTCSNPNKADGATCDDSNACTQTDTCTAGACTGGNPVVCTALDQCHDPGVCFPGTGLCTNPNAADGTTCDDGNSCTLSDTCTAGVCAGTSPMCGDGTLQSGCGEQCDDGNTTNYDGCSATCQLEPPCPAAPRPDCRAPIAFHAGAVTLKKQVAGKGSNKITWKWKGGPATVVADFGAPDTTTTYHFCVYDQTAGTPSLVMGMTVPPGGTCGTKPCWKALKTGFLYKDKLLAAQGVAQITLKGNVVPGKAKLQVKGKGATLPVPLLPFAQDPSVIMQLGTNGGVCWSTTFAPPASKNLNTQFGDKTE
jgi:cysteine-rich repeat protein